MSKRKLLVALALAGAAVPAQAANIVTNGGFETGDFSGWTQFDNSGFTGVGTDFGGVNPFEGSNQAFFGPVLSTGGIFQTLATIVGERYNYHFALHNLGDGPDSFAFSIDGTEIRSLVDAPGFDYRVFKGAFTAMSGNTDLRFSFRHDPSFFLLDAVSVAAVPEPATWAMMILGFGFVGGAMRYGTRATKVAFAAA